jgi:hypothetical protein
MKKHRVLKSNPIVVRDIHHEKSVVRVISAIQAGRGDFDKRHVLLYEALLDARRELSDLRLRA